MPDDTLPPFAIVTRAEAKRRGLNRYFVGKPCKHGHISEHTTGSGSCVECNRLRQNSTGTPRTLARKESRRLGLKTYFSGTPCPQGHVCERWVAGGACCQCARTKGLDRRRKERKQLRILQSLPKQETGLLISRKDAKHRGLNRYFTGKSCKHGHITERQTLTGGCVGCQDEWKRNNSDLLLAQARERGKEKYKTKEGKLYAKLGGQIRRAREAKAGGSFSAEDYHKLRTRQKKCHICWKRFIKSDPATIDHVIPLAKGGLHNASNIALAHRSCNLRKHARRTHLM